MSDSAGRQSLHGSELDARHASDSAVSLSSHSVDTYATVYLLTHPLTPPMHQHYTSGLPMAIVICRRVVHIEPFDMYRRRPP